MLKFLVIRHGESVSNVEQRFSGHQDVELTDTGVWQAGQLFRRLRNHPIDAVYCSDLKRAIHTAKIVMGDRNIPLQIEPQFREIHFGEWEGLKWEEINARQEEGDSNHWWYQPDAPLPGGESLSDLRQRVRIALEKVIKEQLQEDEDRTVAIVCHGGVTRMIIGIALDIPIKKVWHIRQQSTALNIIKYDQKSGFFIDSINDISHLKVQDKKDEAVEKPSDQAVHSGN